MGPAHTPLRKHTLVIAGAGSALEFGAPSTSDLTALVRERTSTDDIMRRFGCDRVCRYIDKKLSGYLDGGAASVNFEHIFHCALEILSNTFEPPPGAVNEFKPILYPFMGQEVASNDKTRLTELVPFSCLKKQSRSLSTLSKDKTGLTELVRCIPELLFSELLTVCDNPKIPLKPLEDFLNLLRNKYNTRIYTTNYDDFILQAAPDLYHGFKSGVGPRSFEPEIFWDSVDRDSVFHLHGSVHFGFPPPAHASDELNVLRWFDDRAEARHFPYSGNQERRMDGSRYLPSALITGFDKLSRIQQTPQAHYYASLARDVMVADVIFVIGFGLTDLHVNARLAEARRRQPCPPVVFVDRWQPSFLCKTRWDMGQKEIKMLHELRMLIFGDHDRDNATRIEPGWTIAKDRSCAVWDRGFLEFLDSQEGFLEIMSQLQVL